MLACLSACRRSNRFYVKTSLLLAFILISPLVHTQTENTEATDVRVIIDVSGSMKRNDPNNLRQPAVELLVELLPEGSKAGVWTFGKWVNMLVPHKRVDDAWRVKATKSANDISSVGLFTNIGGALEKASYGGGQNATSGKKHIILLTDGMVDIAKKPELNKTEWRRIVDNVLPKLKQSGFTIHTIALSNNADRDLMNKLSIATDGVADIAYSAEDLTKIFLKAFDAAVPSEKVPLSDNQFVIDSSVEEFTALIFRKNEEEDVELIGPDNSVLKSETKSEDVRWHRTNQYDLITVSRPFEGEWGVKADMAPQSRVTVVSNLNLRVKPIPNNLMLGSTLLLSASLQEDGKTMSNKELLGLLELRLELSGGATSGDQRQLHSLKLVPESDSLARFTHDLDVLEKEGVYTISIVVDGKTFTRKFSHQLTVRKPFSAEVRERFDAGTLNYVLTVIPYRDDVDVSTVKAVAIINTPDGRKLIKPLQLSEEDNWSAAILPDVEGGYSASVTIKGRDNNGETINSLIENIRFHYSSDAGLAVQKPVFDDKPKPEKTPVTEKKSPEVIEQTELGPENAAVRDSAGLPAWLLYAVMGLANVLLIGVGYIAYRKIMRSDSDDDDDAEPDDSVETAPEVTDEKDATNGDGGNVDDDEEEPPMEDLDADTSEQGAVNEPEVEKTIEADSETNDSVNTNSDIDDLDTMGLDATGDQDLDQSNDADEEGDDMVSAMLEAQGLDLADDELDDAISSLIDDLDDDLDDEGDKKV